VAQSLHPSQSLHHLASQIFQQLDGNSYERGRTSSGITQSRASTGASARPGGGGFERGGQTREHITLVKAAGVNKIVVVINKMDDPTVKWEKARYEEIKEKLTPFLRGASFNLKTDVSWVPVSAYTGANLKERVNKSLCGWWECVISLVSARPRCVNFDLLQWAFAPRTPRHNADGQSQDECAGHDSNLRKI
jgi:Elongation factor Tu GTP binding domain